MKRKYLLKSSINTARFTRLIAKAIDLFIVLILIALFKLFGVLVGLTYLCLCDAMYDGQSIGKRLMGFAVISLEDGKPCSVKQSIVRNLPLSFPIMFALIPPWGIIVSFLLFIPLALLEVYFIFRLDSGHRFGDVMADTSVIGNDPYRMDIRKAKESAFDGNDKTIQPAQSSLYS